MNIYKEIFEHNTDLLERINDETSKSYKHKYLHNEDVFELVLEDIKVSDSVEIADGLMVIHYNPDTYRIVGFTVPYVDEFIDTFKHLEKKPMKKKTIEFTISLPRMITTAQTGLAFAF